MTFGCVVDGGATAWGCVVAAGRGSVITDGDCEAAGWDAGPGSRTANGPAGTDVIALAATAPVATTIAIGNASNRRAWRRLERFGEADGRSGTSNPRVHHGVVTGGGDPGARWT